MIPIATLRGRAAPRALLAVALFLLAACGGSDKAVGTATDNVTGFTAPPVPSPTLAGRGQLVSATPGTVVSRVEVASAITALGLGQAFTARYDAQPYVVRYRTPGVNGQLVEASGAVWIPVGATGALPVVTYMHGTITTRSGAPSNLSATEGRLFGAGYASDGSVAVLPDYLGLGVAGEGTYHPYLHLQTQASAAIDLLRAARTLAAQQSVAIDWRTLFVTGYSQGGAVAMGTLRALQADYATEFPVLGGAPMSGPYDLSGTARQLIEQDPAYGPSVTYTMYLGESMRRVYALAPGASDLFASQYAGTASALVEERATSTQLSALPTHPRAVLQPAVVQHALVDADHPLWRALRDNDSYDWTPRVPLRLYYGGADRDVFPQNALTAETAMRANGATSVAAVNLGATLDHGGAVIPAARAEKRFLDSLRATLVRVHAER